MLGFSFGAEGPALASFYCPTCLGKAGWQLIKFTQTSSFRCSNDGIWI